LQRRDERLAGLVLAAGRSSRFGSDKALANFGGRPLLEHAVAALAALTPRIAVSVRKASQAEARAQSLGLAIVHDRDEAVIGPLAGVLSGLIWAQSIGARQIISLPCDTVLVPERALEDLLRAAGENGAAYILTGRGAESLCAVWPVAGAKVLDRALRDGAHPPVREVLLALGAAAMPVGGDDVFLNVNRPSDLEAAEAILRARTARDKR